MDPWLREHWKRVDTCLLADRARLHRELRRVAAITDEADRTRQMAGVARSIGQSASIRSQRAAAAPRLAYPEELPVSQRRAEIAAAIRDHQVVVVCGATGSGKTTQLPKICLELGRGVAGMIGHTQPRRIAARSVAARIARELAGSSDATGAAAAGAVGGIVGCAIRFDDRTAPNTMLRVMTDGVLLAETQRDRMLRRYDTIILDEAHERSLNIDFLLGYLHRLLPRRPELKLVITSATIDPQRFADHFGGAPVIMVEGRTWPVEIRWRPLRAGDPDEEDQSLVSAILDAVDELAAHDASVPGAGSPDSAADLRGAVPAGPGDVLVFLPGEREIHEVAHALRGRLRPGDEILPLYARLSGEEQDRIFRPHRGRRIVLATNVAETSLTVPGIRHVIDSGLVRMSRRSPRTMVHRLPIEPISQASAAQRAGRCGRLAPGTCIRLYGQTDHDVRPAFTDPEIVRTDLASVILRMKALRLGPIEEFPFPDRPSARSIASGFETLHEIGAIDREGALTAIGHRLARLPLDPRLGRMILTAMDDGGLAEVLVIVAVLSTQDPRVRPADRAGLADLAHARFREQSSDFLGFVRLWDEWRRQRTSATVGGSALRRWCRDNAISWMRMRDWEDTHRQLVDLVARGLVARKDPFAGTPARMPTADTATNAKGRQEGSQQEGGRRRRRRRRRRPNPPASGTTG